mmetsp:Transcript_8521/g.20134  ORF Transcript_8521/g.20134 Transcript_8521/m.20134 type:complete len:425 (+) Transcript_8521:105-1379(+)
MPRAYLRSFGKGLSGTGWPDDSLAMIHRSEQLLRPLIPSMATAEAEVWRATAITANGVLLKVNETRKAMIWRMVDKWEGEAAKEPPRGDAAAALKALRMFGFTCNHSSHAAIVLQALASGKVTWLSDNSVSGPAAIEGDPPPPPQPSQVVHVMAELVQPPQPQQPPPPSPPSGSQLCDMVDGWSGVAASAPSPQPQTPSTAAQPSTPPQGWSELHQRGYLKVTRAVDPSWLDATALTAESVEVRRGEDPDGEVGGDEKRSMRSLPSGLSSLLGGVIMAALGARDLLGERDRLDMRLLVSQPGGAPQRVHCDDDPGHPVYQGGSEASALCSGILALEAGTSLLLYPSGPEGTALPVLLDAGDLLLFRGDCWHAGAGYACLNRRIHFYLSAPRRRRKPGYTYWYTPPATAAEPLAKRVRTQRIMYE